MLNKKMFIAAIAVCMAAACSCSKEEMPGAPETQEEISGEEEVIAQGSGNSGQVSATDPQEPAAEDIEDPGEVSWETGAGLSPDELPVIESESLSDCMTLCGIDGLHVDFEMREEPTEEDALVYAKLIKDANVVLDAEAAVRPGDVVNIDMYADDNALTRIGTSVRVGYGSERPEIEDALVGMSKGEEKRISVTYPKDYTFMDLNGKTIEYKIICNRILRPEDPTEVEVGRALVYLEEETERVNRTGLTAAAKRAFVENSEFRAYPEKVVRQARSRYEWKYISGFSSLDEFLDKVGMTRAEFRAMEDEYVSQYAKEQLVLMALQEETGITTASSEYGKYTALYGINDDDPDETLFEVIVENIKDRLDYGG